MNDLAEVFLEKRVDAQDRILVALRLDNVAHGERPHIAAVFEVARVERLFANLIKDLPSSVPWRKHPRRSGSFRSRYKFVFVVLFRPPDHTVLRYILDDLLHFT